MPYRTKPRRHSFPSWNGDYSLIGIEGKDDRCKLVCEEPTPAELEIVGAFLVKARKKKWVSDTAGIPETGGELEIAASVTEAGHVLLARRGRKRKGIITVVKSIAGEVEVVEGDDPKAHKEAAKKAGGGSEAVTTRRPTLCCPSCVSGPDRRASRVLARFLTPTQLHTWREHGYIECYGGTTGRCYRLHHRHHPVAIRRGHLGVDMSLGRTVDAYDWSMPPAEEVLAIMHALQHRECWVRNPAGGFSGSPECLVDPFRGPGNQLDDGIPDSNFVSTIGAAVRGFNIGAPIGRQLRRRFIDTPPSSGLVRAGVPGRLPPMSILRQLRTPDGRPVI
jgi:hypothetical protein